uniref:CCHC-type domain-containing protein n=1 Tax=Anser cygnoides TaxID=8845 RepID=A0A8B9DNE3_ANSCY
MGASLSAEEEAIVKLLKQLLIARGVKYDPFKIKLLLKILRKQGFPSMASTAFDVKTWDQAGEKIWEAASSGDTNAAEVMTTWWLVTETLRAWQAEKEVQNAAAQAIKAAKPRSEPARSPQRCNLIDLGDDKEEGHGPPPQSPFPLTPSAPALPTPDNASLGARAFDPRERWELVRREALKDGDPVEMAFPVQVRPNGPNEYNAFHWDLIKELRKTVTTYGLHAPFTQSLLVNVMTGQLLVLYDCHQVAAMILMPTQKLLWEQKWKEGCELAALGNIERQPGDPLRGSGIPQLVGTEPLLDPRLQARLDDAILRQSASLAFQAMLKLPEVGKAEPSFTSIRQQITEPYMQFIDRLRDALDKQIDNREAKEALILKLAVENANTDCKKILQALPANTTLVQMIEACNRVGSIEHHTAALAGAFATALKTGRKRCFRCRATGHFATECPQRGAGGGTR